MIFIADKSKRWCPDFRKCGGKQVRYHRQGCKNKSGQYICDDCGKTWTKEQMMTVNNLKKTNNERKRENMMRKR